MGVGFSQGPRASCATLGWPLKTSLQSLLFMKCGQECLTRGAAVKSNWGDVGKAPHAMPDTVQVLIKDFPFLFPL